MILNVVGSPVERCRDGGMEGMGRGEEDGIRDEREGEGEGVREGVGKEARMRWEMRRETEMRGRGKEGRNEVWVRRRAGRRGRGQDMDMAMEHINDERYSPQYSESKGDPE